jgi:hypothetical protein
MGSTSQLQESENFRVPGQKISKSSEGAAFPYPEIAAH